MLLIMDDETAGFNREHFDRVEAKLERILQAIETLTARAGSLEEQMSLERKEVRPICEDLVRLEHQIDRLNARLDHIEMRLDLINPPAAR